MSAGGVVMSGVVDVDTVERVGRVRPVVVLPVVRKLKVVVEMGVVLELDVGVLVVVVCLVVEELVEELVVAVSLVVELVEAVLEDEDVLLVTKTVLGRVAVVGLVVEEDEEEAVVLGVVN
jgi:hypothetical protein